MVEIFTGLFGLYAVICVVAFTSWIVDKLYNVDYRHKVTAEDLAELSRLFDDETSFVGYNEKGEKFLCGYIKD
jgi:hypothetical protein